MSRSQSTGRRRGFAGLLPFLLGVPLSVGILWLALYGPLSGGLLERYLSHPVEWAEVILFVIAMVVLTFKFFGLGLERSALRRELVPAWDGQPVPATEISTLCDTFSRQPRRYHGTLLGRRIQGILDFLRHRRSAAGLDDHLRTAADNDAIAQEGGGTLVRLIIWAIPILGFLGTVLGITDAVAGVTPDKLENSLNEVTDGLALAFDTTALALALTMALMLYNSMVDRLEQGVLGEVDAFIDDQLAHRFERTETASGSDAGVWRHAMEELVKRQAVLWADALAQTDRRRIEAETKLTDALVQSDRRRTEAETKLQERLQTTLGTALERTLDAHSRRLAEMETLSAKHLTHLMGKMEELAKSAAGHAETLRRIHEGEKQLLILQQSLQQNLQALAGAGAFDQAVHSLTAAIHLLTSQTRGHRPGAAA